MNKQIRILAAFAAIAAICLSSLGGGAGVGIAQTTQAYAFVINEDGNSIAVIDAAAGKVLIVHDMNGTLNKPHLSAYDPVTHRLYVGNKGANLVVLDMTDVMAPKTVANFKPGGPGEIHRVVLAGGMVWLAHEGDSMVYAYDVNDLLSSPKVKLGKEFGFDTTHGLTLRPGTNELWATNRPTKGQGTLLRIDVQTRLVIGKPLTTTGKEGDRPNNIEFTADGKWAYVVNTGTKATQVTVVDAQKFEVVKQIDQDATVGAAPHAIVYDPVSTRMFVVNKDSPTLTAISTKTNSVLGYFTIGAEPHGITLGPDGLIYATAKKGNKVIAFDPQRLMVLKEITDPKMIGPHQIVFTAAFVQATATPVPPSPTAMPVTTATALATATTAATPEVLPTQVAPQVEPTARLQQPTPEPAEVFPTRGSVVIAPAGMPRTGGSSPDLSLLALSVLLLIGVGFLLSLRSRKATR